MTTMREAFESFALARNCPPSALLPLEDGTYKQDGTLAGMWAAWQAATLAAQSEIDRLNTQRRDLQTERIDLLERLARADVDAQRMVLAERERLRALIANDAHACTFQSMGKYRSALLAALSNTAAIRKGKE